MKELLELLRRELPRVGFYGAIGMDLVSLDESSCVLRTAVADRHLNLSRLVHGGVLFALADSALGLAFLPHLAARGGVATPTMSISIEFLEKVDHDAKELRATARMLRIGRSAGFAEAEVHADGKLAAKAIGTVAIVPFKG